MAVCISLLISFFLTSSPSAISPPWLPICTLPFCKPPAKQHGVGSVPCLDLPVPTHEDAQGLCNCLPASPSGGQESHWTHRAFPRPACFAGLQHRARYGNRCGRTMAKEIHSCIQGGGRQNAEHSMLHIYTAGTHNLSKACSF